MPDHPKPNVFAPEFLARLRDIDSWNPTAAEAAYAGPWIVEPLGEEQFAVGRETDDDPEAILQCRETAHLLAAVLPLVGRDRNYTFVVNGEAPDEYKYVLQAFDGMEDLRTVGRLRLHPAELIRLLSLTELLLRSPQLMAHFLEAASCEVLEQAGTIFAQRLANREGGES